MATSSRIIKIGITMGDPSGVGPEITALALAGINDQRIRFTVIGDRWVFDKVAASGVGRHTFVDLRNVPKKNFSFGKVRAEYGRASLEYLDKALEMLRAQKLDCLVTSPVSKEAASKAGAVFYGQTEYLAARTRTKRYAMMLLNGPLRITLVTRHVPLSLVSSLIDGRRIRTAVELTYTALRAQFGRPNPKIVVCGLNPHASDNGLIGREENNVIRPALRLLRKQGINADGPFPADSALARAYAGDYDAAIAMYHDQALIPLKIAGGNAGVNLTVGLPFVRTSPLHGTAFDIAGRRLASAASLQEAIRCAFTCTTIQKKASARIS